jgi:hypothetical protein
VVWFYSMYALSSDLRLLLYDDEKTREYSRHVRAYVLLPDIRWRWSICRYFVFPSLTSTHALLILRLVTVHNEEANEVTDPADERTKQTVQSRCSDARLAFRYLGFRAEDSIT